MTRILLCALVTILIGSVTTTTVRADEPASAPTTIVQAVDQNGGDVTITPIRRYTYWSGYRYRYPGYYYGYRTYRPYVWDDGYDYGYYPGYYNYPSYPGYYYAPRYYYPPYRDYRGPYYGAYRYYGPRGRVGVGVW